MTIGASATLSRGSVNQVPVLIATCFATACGGLIFNTMPVLLGAIAEVKGFDESTLGVLSSEILLGTLLGIIGALFWVSRLPWRPTMALAAGLSIIASALIPFSDTPLVLGLVFGAIGFCLGSIYAPALAALGHARDQAKAFGLGLIFQVMLSALIAFVLPTFLTPLLGEWAITLILGFTGLLVILSYGFLPIRPEETLQIKYPTPLKVLKGNLPIAGIIGLMTMAIFYIGIMGLWQFLERLGINWELSKGYIGGVIALALIIGVGGAAVPTFVGMKYGLIKPYLIAVFLMILAIFIFLIPNHAVPFAIGVILINIGWSMAGPFMYTVVAQADPSGRLLVATVIVQTGGAIIGALIAGQILSTSSFPGLFGFFSICMLITVVLYSYAVALIGKRNRIEASI